MCASTRQEGKFFQVQADIELQKYYRPSHQLESRYLVRLLSELATGWKAGSSFHSALGRLATPEFIYEKSLLSS